MTKPIYFDFSVDSVIAIEAEYGTDPDSLVDEVSKRLIQKIKEGDITFTCENTFDPETGSHAEVPIEWYEDY